MAARLPFVTFNQNHIPLQFDASVVALLIPDSISAATLQLTATARSFSNRLCYSVSYLSSAGDDSRFEPSTRETRIEETFWLLNQQLNENYTMSRHDAKKPNASGRLRQLSHKLSLVLRHKAIEFGFDILPDGFVPVQQLLDDARFNRFTISDIEAVVRGNDKQRFKLQRRPAADFPRYRPSNPSPTILSIRANQGHSIPTIDPDLLLEKLTSEQVAALPAIIHGTYQEAWRSIQRQGLRKMGRNHIHFASGFPGENGVISGMRKTCNVYIFVDAQKCADENVVFYQSDNGVLLTAGLENCLPVKFFSKVVDPSGKELKWKVTES